VNGNVHIFAFELAQNVRGILRTDVPKSVDLRQEAIRRRSVSLRRTLGIVSGYIARKAAHTQGAINSATVCHVG